MADNKLKKHLLEKINQISEEDLDTEIDFSDGLMDVMDDDEVKQAAEDSVNTFLEEKVKRISDLEQTIEGNGLHIAELTDKLQGTTVENDKLSKMLKGAREKLKQLEEKNENNNLRIQQLVAKVAQSTTDNDELSAMLKAKDEIIAELEASVKNIEGKVQELISESNDYQGSFTNQLATKEKKIKELQATIADNKLQSHTLEVQSQNFEAEKADLQALLATKEKRITELEQAANELQSSSAGYDEQIQKLTSEYAENKESYAHHLALRDEKIIELEGTIDANQEQINELITELNQTESAESKSKERLTEQENRINELENSVEAYVAKIQELTAEVSDTVIQKQEVAVLAEAKDKQIQAMEQAKQGYEAQVQELAEHISRFKASQAETVEDLREAAVQLEEKDNRIAELEELIKGHGSQLQELQDKIAVMTENESKQATLLESKDAKIAELEANYTESWAKAKQLTSEAELKEASMKELEERLAGIEKEKNDLQISVGHLRAQNDIYQIQKDIFEMKVKELVGASSEKASAAETSVTLDLEVPAEEPNIEETASDTPAPEEEVEAVPCNSVSEVTEHQEESTGAEV